MQIKKLVLLLLTLLLLTSCSIEKNSNTEIEQAEDNKYTINTNGMTVDARYPAPEAYSKITYAEDSFSEFLRQQELKPYGAKVLYYNGRTKDKNDVYDSVFCVDIGNRDLHQCADAIMLLRAEYLYSQGLYDEIGFDFVSGFRAEYNKWIEGYRIKVEGNNVAYYKTAEAGNTYKSFRKYMEMVMAYASTLSLEKELKTISVNELEIGDIFIIGGSPGHAIIVVDAAISADNEKVFLLAQSYMPAQETQLLLNPVDEVLSPWYSLKDKEKLVTPEWTFQLTDLKRF